MNNTLPTRTIEDYLDKYAQRNSKDINWHNFLFFLSHNKKIEHTKIAMHEYGVLMARHYVQEALKQAASNYELNCSCDSWESCKNKVDKESILTAFDINTIK